ncbi:VanZ family protein [Nocardioides marmorisolisilvae]|uniref:VanZ family protein n=1 Tax=Nocardioides marmorisolisilvae TaxID=1542737 RepID=A0A3N0DUP6_9ACTN|nr:VanZ family protein [Nocardioides marmorisolisilvae]RNL79318.1 VanZ family protein [Nocardioides marmorisolisilvae]
MRWFSAFLLALYAVFVARLTLADPSAGRPVFSAFNYWSELFAGGRLDGSQLEVIANVLLFVPAGLLLAIVLGRPLLTIALCVLASTGIELAQRTWFPMRVPSIADVEHNGFGAIIGVLIFAVVGWGISWLNGPASPTPVPTPGPAPRSTGLPV